MTLKHLLANILGVGENKPKKTKATQKKKKKGMFWEIISFSMCIHTQRDKHEHAGQCMGVCTINFVSINLTHFKCIFMGPKRLSRNSKLLKQIKKSLLEEQKSLVKHCLCAVTMRFPRAIWKPKQLKFLFVHLKGLSRAKGAVLGFAFRPQVWRAGENT